MMLALIKALLLIQVILVLHNLQIMIKMQIAELQINLQIQVLLVLLMHNLQMAKWYAAEFAAYLEANADHSEIFEYPAAERLVTGDGQHFYDS